MKCEYQNKQCDINCKFPQVYEKCYLYQQAQKHSITPREALRRLEFWLDSQLEINKLEVIELNRRNGL